MAAVVHEWTCPMCGDRLTVDETVVAVLGPSALERAVDVHARKVHEVDVDDVDQLR